MHRLSATIEYVTNVALVILISALTVSTASQVVTRFITRSPLVWTEEVSRMTFIWVALLGSTVAVKHKEHLALDILTGKVPLRVSAVIWVLVHMMMITVALIFIVGGWDFLGRNATRTSDTAGIPMTWLYIAGPLTGVLMLFYLIEQIPALITAVGEAFEVSSRRLGS